MIVFKVIELLRDDIPPQPHGPATVVVVHIAVDAVFVDALGEQLTYYIIYLRTGGVVGKPSRVGHHAAVYLCGAAAGHHVKTTQLPYHAEHHLRGAAQLGMRHHQLHALLFGVQVMVHHHLVACGFGEHRCHFVYARHSIEVDAEY